MKDFLLDMTGKTLFADGDIRTGESDRQHQDHLIRCAKGSFKQFPATCVGAADFLEDEDEGGLVREVRNQFTADGMTVRRIAIEDGKLKVDASY